MYIPVPNAFGLGFVSFENAQATNNIKPQAPAIINFFIYFSLIHHEKSYAYHF